MENISQARQRSERLRLSPDTYVVIIDMASGPNHSCAGGSIELRIQSGCNIFGNEPESVRAHDKAPCLTPLTVLNGHV